MSKDIELDGVVYWRDAKGNLVPKSNVRAADVLMDEMISKIIAYGVSLSAEMGRFYAHTEADIAAYDALMEQEYGISAGTLGKGNRSFSSFDGCLKVQVSVNDTITMGPELQAAKALLDAMITERGEGVDTFLLTLVRRAFRVDQAGKVDVRAILALRRMEVDDDRWSDFCRAIDDSVRVVGSKRYLRLYRRPAPDAAWQMIPMDLATARPTPDAMDHPSLRRQVEHLTGICETYASAVSQAWDSLLNGDAQAAKHHLEQILVNELAA